MRGAAAFVALLLLTAAAPAPPPSPPADATPPAIPGAIEVKAQTYVVQPGDTLSRIIAKTGAGSDAIAQANRLEAPFVVRPGQKLKIPAGRYHLVQKGERGIAIGRAYGVDWNRIAELNHLEEPFTLRAGERLLIPSTREVAGMSMEERAKAFRIDIDDLVTGNEPALAPKAKPAAPVKTAARPVPASVAVAEPAAAFSGRFAWPLTGDILRRYGLQASGARNDGVNIRARMGETVRAAADGVVAYAGDLAAFGKLVLIRHGNGWLTAYGHADSLLVTRGQAVKQGQPIAKAGATGSAREPQLHFEIRDGRKPVNPLSWLPGRS
ncbi:peptidoglycan DD-metalloendopeptidase family protein [Sphingomonas sp. BIUV-7]|uniref:Peptidoglycan DD-metalloendopeptidase family protein n=1 Tax=Sphingomonas natans TaxID=3063330 RepID=A0ABT8YBM0_9SPHN|nr:M23 family metallopeptidase [Sphingomonas sp. BIUV-7]MDO6415715.1 peptidoglycan DD-metalloendopeptidase family protein [Sphingomonas sp. BIUV-7]